MAEQFGTNILHEGIIDYPINGEGKLVTRRGQITRLKPKLDAPPASQPGSVDWTLNMIFGSSHRALQMIESLVAGQGDNADERWVQFILVYKKWQIEFDRGDLDKSPTFNQVCHTLNLPTEQFLRDLQMGVQNVMTKVAHLKASLAVPEVMDMVIERAKAEDADVKERELHLKIAGVIDEKGGVNVNINNSNQVAVLNKGEKDKMKTPLLQFSQTVTEIDDEVRRDG
jgi:hypothetical protein